MKDKVYTIACTAHIHRMANYLTIVAMSGIVFADGQDEANGSALRFCKERMTEGEGYFNHAATATELPQATLAHIAQLHNADLEQINE